MPYAELTRLYQIDRIRRQYELFAAALGTKFRLEEYHREAGQAVQELQEVCKGKSFVVGQVVNGNPLEMALALLKMGFEVKSVFAAITEEDYPYIREIGEYNPNLRIYSTLSPTMMNYDGDQDVDISIGTDAAFYYPKSVNVKWNDEIQPFGYRGLKNFANEVAKTWKRAAAAAGKEADDAKMNETKE